MGDGAIKHEKCVMRRFESGAMPFGSVAVLFTAQHLTPNMAWLNLRVIGVA